MKRVLFIVSNLGCGGINRSLENLISLIKDENLELNVLAFDTTGQYSSGFTGASLIKPNKIIDYLTRNLAEQKGINWLLTSFLKVADRVSGSKLARYVDQKEKAKIINGKYDAVIAFSEGKPTHFLAPLDVKHKTAWIHCDYKSYLTFSPGKEEQEIRAYDSYETVVCVSDFTTKSFIDVVPTSAGRAKSIANVLNVGMMRSQAQEFIPDYSDGFNIVTVGRIDPVKRPSVIPQILSEILIYQPNTHWYLVGPVIWQSEHDKLISEIKKYGVADHLHILGGKDNPYPYIKNANLLVNTSVSEACPYVINEAKVLGTPVVCTDFGSATQFLTNGLDGYSVSLDRMSQTIIHLIKHTDKYSKLKEYLKGFEYDNETIKNQFLDLLK